MDIFKKRTISEEWGEAKRFALDKLHARSITVSANDRALRRMKDRHHGETAFILGNGPSLHVEDLDRLVDQTTFASNKIFLAFSQTEWRPSYYSVSDRLVAKNNAAIISGLPLSKILSDDIREYIQHDTHTIWFHERFTGEGFSPNILYGSVSGATIIFHQLQLAYYMGIREVYLIGVDFSFTVPRLQVKTEIPGYEIALCSSGERNHFHPDYRKPGEVWGVPDLDAQLRSFTSAKAAFEAVGRKIFNASRTSKLEVFPRITFEMALARASEGLS